MIHTRMKLLRYTVLSAGFLAMTLRALLYAAAIDQKGLLAAGHWATWSILVLTVLTLGAALLMTRKIQGPADYADCYPVSYLQGTGSLLLAGAIFQRAISLYAVSSDRLNLIAAISGFTAVLALLVAGICRMIPKKPSFLCHSVVSIFFALQLVSQYRSWSADPQLMDYCFYLAAFICLMFTAYFLAGFEADLPNHRGLVFSSMAATFFCCLALPESGDAPLLISCALWAFSCTPRMQAKRQRPSNEEPKHDYS